LEPGDFTNSYLFTPVTVNQPMVFENFIPGQPNNVSDFSIWFDYIMTLAINYGRRTELTTGILTLRHLFSSF